MSQEEKLRPVLPPQLHVFSRSGLASQAEGAGLARLPRTQLGDAGPAPAAQEGTSKRPVPGEPARPGHPPTPRNTSPRLAAKQHEGDRRASRSGRAQGSQIKPKAFPNGCSWEGDRHPRASVSSHTSQAELTACCPQEDPEGAGWLGHAQGRAARPDTRAGRPPALLPRPRRQGQIHPLLAWNLSPILKRICSAKSQGVLDTPFAKETLTAGLQTPRQRPRARASEPRPDARQQLKPAGSFHC